MDATLEKFYKEIIIAHTKNPYGYTNSDYIDNTLCISAFNPVCGDNFKIFIELKNGHIGSVAFNGAGCAISKASTSILLKNIERKTLSEALQLCGDFIDHVEGKKSNLFNCHQELQAFQVIQKHKGRLKCAVLSWNALAQSINVKRAIN